MIELYGSPTSSAHTIAIMLEEINVNYSVFPVTKDNTEQLELEFLKPNSLFPLILDREGPNNKPLVLSETSAILLYLAEKSGHLIPEDQSDKFDVLQWLLFENSKIGPTLGNSKHFMYHAPESVPYAIKRFNNETKRIFSIIEKQLSENDYIAGDYSIADIATYPWIKDYERHGMTGDELPNIVSWLDRLNEREAVRKGFDVMMSLKD
jgi:GST-like protein